MDGLLDILLIILTSHLHYLPHAAKVKKLRQICVALSINILDTFDDLKAFDEHIETITCPLPVIKALLDPSVLSTRTMRTPDGYLDLNNPSSWWKVGLRINNCVAYKLEHQGSMRYTVCNGTAVAVFTDRDRKWQTPSLEGQALKLQTPEKFSHTHESVSDLPIIKFIPRPYSMLVDVEQDMCPYGVQISRVEESLAVTPTVSTQTEECENHTIENVQLSEEKEYVHVETQTALPKHKHKCTRPNQVVHQAVSQIRKFVQTTYDYQRPCPLLQELPFFPRRKARSLRRKPSRKRIKLLSHIADRLEASIAEAST